MKWTHQNIIINSVRDLPEDAYGFVYCITFDDNKKYIGKKNIYTFITVPALKSGKSRPNVAYRIGKNVNGKRKYYDAIKKESNWMTYEGSKKDTEGRKVKSKEILEFVTSKRALTYLEARYLFEFRCIESDEYINNNILGKFFRDNLI